MSESPSKVVQLNPKDLVPHPDNPRGKLEEKDVADLVSVLEAQGQQQPCVVRPHPDSEGKYQVVIGHRRTTACRALKRDVACLVVPFTDDQALAVMLADNPSHAAPDPLREAEAVAAFLKFPNFNLQDVADRLGKSPRWVAQRANLSTLTGSSRKRLKDWPVSWLEEMAKLSPEAQDELKEHEFRYCNTIGDVKRLVAARTHDLGSAPWKLDDATLVPKAGACTTCPKQSLCSPGLFDDGAPGTDVSKGTCRDAACWNLKAAAHLAAAVKAAIAEDPKTVVIAEDHHLRGAKLEGTQVLNPWRVKAAKKGDKGARPAVKVSETGAITRGFVKADRPASSGSSGGSAPRAKPLSPAEKLKQSKEQIRAARADVVAEGIRAAVEESGKKSPPKPEVVMGLVACFGSRGSDLYMFQREKAVKKAREYYAAAAKSPTAFAKAVWPLLVDGMEEFGDVGDEQLPWIAEVLGIDLKPLEAKALKDVPDPAWWTAAAAPEKKGLKGKGAKKAAAAAAS